MTTNQDGRDALRAWLYDNIGLIAHYVDARQEDIAVDLIMAAVEAELIGELERMRLLFMGNPTLNQAANITLQRIHELKTNQSGGTE